MKGQQARSGPGPRPGFEGGQTPLIRRLPRRRGFKNPFRVAFAPVNLRGLARFTAGSEVTIDALRQAGVIRSPRRPIKLLAKGDVTAALTVRAHRVSAAARAKIEAAGGTVEELMPRPAPPEEGRRAERRAKAKAGRQAAPSAGEPEVEKIEESDDSGSETSESAGPE
jgi:large subunit ribosomal protein L15